jgi:hypothetical protein
MATGDEGGMATGNEGGMATSDEGGMAISDENNIEDVEWQEEDIDALEVEDPVEVSTF